MKLNSSKIKSKKIEPENNKKGGYRSISVIHKSYMKENYNTKKEYNPKKCSMKRLIDMIPNFPHENFDNKGNENYMNFYKTNKKYLIFYTTKTTLKPEQMKSPYSDFSPKVGNLNFLENSKLFLDLQIKVDLYENENGIKYILKSFWHFFDLKLESTEVWESLENFISKR